MAEVIQSSRIQHHRWTTTSVIPTVPSGTEDPTSSDFLTTDIKRGEIAINLADDKIWFRSANGIIEISTTTAGSSPFVWSGTNIVTNEPGGVTPNVLPKNDDVSNLGSATKRWKDLYLGSVIDFKQTLLLTNNNNTSADFLGRIGIGFDENFAQDNDYLVRLQANDSNTGEYSYIEVGQSSSKFNIPGVVEIKSSDGAGAECYSQHVATGGTPVYNLNVYDTNDGSLVQIFPSSARIETDLASGVYSKMFTTGTDVTLWASDGSSIDAKVIVTTTSVAIEQVPFIPALMTSTQRDALTAATGMTIYNTTSNTLECYNGSTWKALF